MIFVRKRVFYLKQFPFADTVAIKYYFCLPSDLLINPRKNEG
jgi:hypothetical protein